MTGRRRNGPQRPLGRPHGEGRGLGLLLLIVLGSLARAEDPASILPDDRLGIRTAPLLLLCRPDVRADLGLSAQQVEGATAAAAELHARAMALRGKSGNDAVAGRRAVDEAQRRWLESNLSPIQRNRLLQIDLQWEGGSALMTRPVVADSIGISPEQRQRLAGAIAHRDAARRQGQGVAASEATLARAVEAILTPPQRERWWSMRGRPFVPQLAESARGGRAVR